MNKKTLVGTLEGMDFTPPENRFLKGRAKMVDQNFNQ